MASTALIAQVIFNRFKTEDEQVYVTLPEVIDVLSSLFHGIFSPRQIDRAVNGFAENRGLASELAFFNEKEFADLMNRLLDLFMEEVDANGDGFISRKEFYDNLCQVYGWQARLAKRHIHRTYDNAVKHCDMDGDDLLSRDELQELLRKLALGEISPADVFSVPKLVIL